MKYKTLILIGTSLMILSACNGSDSEEESKTTNIDTEESTENAGDNNESEKSASSKAGDSVLIDKEKTESGWINYEGEFGGNIGYLTTGPIEYDPSKQYELSHGGYIAYYNGEEFIETSQMGDGGLIKQVESADNIRISYHDSFNKNINLVKQ